MLSATVRTLARPFRNYAFALGVILPIALGVGVNTAVFSVVNGVLMHPLPFPDNRQLMVLNRVGENESDVSIPDGEDLRSRSAFFDDIALFLPFWEFDLVDGGRPERLIGSVAEPRFFRILGVKPLKGRLLTDDDNRPGAERVVVINSALWRGRFGGDPGIVGRALILNDHPTTIVGVAGAEADILERGVQLWTPVAAETPGFLHSRGTNNFQAIGRLKPGISERDADAELRSITTNLSREFPQTNQSKILTAIPLRESVVGKIRPFLLMLWAAVGLVLLIVCVNLASLQLVRSSEASGEIGVRLALGGSRRGVIFGLLTETGILILTGLLCSALLAHTANRWLVAWAPSQLPRAGEIGTDWRVLLFTATISVAMLLVIGLIPAVHASRVDPAGLLSASGMRASRGRNRGRLLDLFVVAEMALAFLLLVGTGLVLRSLINLQKVHLGFDPSHRIAVNLVLPESRYSDLQRQSTAFQDMLARLNALPGLESAAFVIGAPMTTWGAIGHRVAFRDRPLAEPGNTASARNRPVLGDYFRTAGIKIISGRGLNARDTAASERVAVVNQEFARQYFPNQDPVGKQIAWLSGDRLTKWMTVVGVVSDVKIGSLEGPDDRSVYTSYLQREESWQRFGTVLLKSRQDQASLAEAIRQAVWSVDSTIPVPEIHKMESLVSAATARQRYVSWILGIFSAVALALALQGIYGLLSYIAVRRRAEIGVRIAVGASKADILKLFLRHGVLLAAAGILCGLSGCFVLIRLISALLFGVAPTDPTTYGMVASGMLAAALAACAFPALRASTVDPRQTLGG